MYDQAPISFFGPGYSYASSEIKLKTSGASAMTTGGTLTANTLLNTITFTTAHNLKARDRVRFTTTGTLPAPLVAATDYYVSAVLSDVAIQITAAIGSPALALTTNGTGTNTMQHFGPLAEVTNLEAAAEVGGTGDWRKVVYGIMEMLHSKYIGTPVEDRPNKLVISRSSTVDEETGLITRTYFVNIVTESTAAEVVAE